MEILREREIRESLEKQMVDEQRTRGKWPDAIFVFWLFFFCEIDKHGDFIHHVSLEFGHHIEIRRHRRVDVIVIDVACLMLAFLSFSRA